MDTVNDTATNENVAITVHRKEVPALTEGSEKGWEKILAFVKIEWALSLRQMAIRLGGVFVNLLHGFERFNLQSKL
jgi:hypothetical protein